MTIGLLLCLGLASVGLRAWLLFARPLWFDELFTLWASRLPLRELIAALHFDSGPPGFYLVEKPFAWLAGGLGGDGDAWLRVPSFLAVLAMFFAARTLPPGVPRATFVMLVSGSMLVNLYAAEARPYGLLAVLALALFLLALRGEERWGRLGAVSALAALALYTHYLALFAVAALLILAAAARRWRSCLALAAGGVCFTPWLPVLGVQPAAAIAWMRETPGRSLAGFLSSLGGVGRVPTPFGAAPPPFLFAAGAVVGAVLLLSLLASSRKDRSLREAAAFVLLVLAGAGLAGFWRPVAFAGRTELAVLPVWIWGLSRAASGPGRRLLSLVCVLAAALGVSATVRVVAAPHPNSPPGAVAEWVASTAAPGDSVVAAASFYLPARLLSEQGRLAVSVLPLTGELERHPGWFATALPGADEEARLLAARERVPPGKRLFLLIPPVYATAGLAAALGSEASTGSAPAGVALELFRSPDALIVVWERPR